MSHFLLQLWRSSRDFCRPNFDQDNKIKSLAYRRQLSLVLFGSINRSASVVSNNVANSFI